MDHMTRYKAIVRSLIEEYASYKPSVGEVRVEAICQDETGHYELVHAGWVGTHRVHGSVVHVDVRDGKVFIERDGTDDVVAERLVEAGIPKDRIVLAFKPPGIRPETGYAVA